MLADSLCFIWIDFILPEKLSWLWKYGCKNANFETSQSKPPPLSLLPPFHTHANTHTTSKTSQWRLRSKIDLRVAPNDNINAIIKKFENHPSIQKIKENGNWYHIFPFLEIWTFWRRLMSLTVLHLRKKMTFIKMLTFLKVLR